MAELFLTINKGFLLGISTALYCCGSCVPILVPYLVCSNKIIKSQLRALAEFACGRLLAYFSLSLPVALYGMRVQPTFIFKKIIGIAVIGLAALMIIYGLVRNFPQWRLCSKFNYSLAVRRFPMLTGLLLGINICPPLLLCLTYLLTLHNIFSAILFTSAFFLGTSVLLIPLIFAYPLNKIRALREVAEVSFLFCGLWFIIKGISMLNII